MLKHWLVRNGKHVEDEVRYITVHDDNSLSQIDEVLFGIRKAGWKIGTVFVLEDCNKRVDLPLMLLITRSIKS